MFDLLIFLSWCIYQSIANSDVPFNPTENGDNSPLKGLAHLSIEERAFCPILNGEKRFEMFLHQQCHPDFDDKCARDELESIKGTKYHCARPDFLPPEYFKNVSLIDSSEMWKLLNKKDAFGRPWCMVSLFYAPGCPFSARLAPFFNALPDVFPILNAVAIDATEFSKLNSRYGITGTPTVILWVNGLGIARMEDRGLDMNALKSFVTHWTDLAPRSNVNQTAEYPLHITLDDNAHRTMLIGSWAVMAFGLLYYLCGTEVVVRILDRFRDGNGNNHRHQD